MAPQHIWHKLEEMCRQGPCAAACMDAFRRQVMLLWHVLPKSKGND